MIRPSRFAPGAGGSGPDDPTVEIRLAALEAAAADIQSSLSGLGNRTEWQTQIDNLKAAVANMQSAADSLAASPGARGVASNVRTAVAGVNDSIRRLLTAVGSRCPSPSPSAVPSS